MIRAAVLIVLLTATTADADDGVYGRWRPVAGACNPAGWMIGVGRLDASAYVRCPIE